MNDFFLAVDFDGTIAETDVTDTILTEFARPEWLEVEELWVNGVIGSQECLTRQMALIDATMDTLLTFVDNVAIDSHFHQFVQFVRTKEIPFAIISDGFSQFIRRILANADIRNVPVYANNLAESNGQIKTSFSNSAIGCPAGTCKCWTARKLSPGLPVVLIGDGRSDFCLADKADYVFAKGKLTVYCQEKGIPFTAFEDFGGVIRGLKRFDCSNLCRVG